jgi:cyanate lyase
MTTERPITDVLLRAIADSGMSFKALERETGVLRQSLMGFAKGQQSLRSDLVDKLAVFFKLELRPKRKSR